MMQMVTIYGVARLEINMFLYNKSKAFFSKLISGGFGLPITFWVFGVLVAIVLGLLMKNITTPWQSIVFLLIAIIQFVLITIAVWNAANKYSGSLLWNWGAKIAVIAGVARWLWFLPDLAAAFLSVIGMPIYSSEYWELDGYNLSCKPALYQRTPENMKKRHHGCTTTENSNRDLITLRCQTDEVKGNFIFTKNSNDCNKYLAKLQAFRNKK